MSKEATIDEISNDKNLHFTEVYESMRPIVSYLAVGDNTALEDQLIVKSRQPNILKFTPKDAAERFGNRAMFKEWLANGHEVHWLLNHNNDLAGIIWYRKKKFPLDIDLAEIPEETFAIRLYEGYAGHHLSNPFMKLSLQTAVRIKQEHGKKITGIWLQTDTSNEAAVAAYNKFGYQEVYRDNSRVTMVLTPAEIVKESNEQ